jgi:hypothetical protein
MKKVGENKPKPKKRLGKIGSDPHYAMVRGGGE